MSKYHVAVVCTSLILAMISIETASELAGTLGSPGIYAVKPRVILQRLEESPLANDLLLVPLPPSTLGSIPVFDAVVLACVIKLVRPKRVLEFGTFLGYSTRIILENSDDDCEIVSIDLPHGSKQGDSSLDVTDMQLHSSAAINDDFLRQLQFRHGARYLDSLTASQQRRLNLIKADSRQVKPDSLVNEAGACFDLIFIDGGHDAETIASDSALAFATASGKATVVWHDFGSTIHTDVTDFINKSARHLRILSVKGTLIAMTHCGPDPILQP